MVRFNAGGSHPQIEFTAASGEKVSYPQGGVISGYHEGYRVRVVYYAKDPAAYPCVDNFGALWGSTTMIGVMGIVFFTSGFMLVRGANKLLPPQG